MRSASATAAALPEVCRFGHFELRVRERLLLAHGAPVALGARALDLLAVLAARAGSLVTKEDLLERVWSGLVVEENNLQVQVSQLRKVLGQTAVATIPGRGYRFELSVERDAATDPPPAQVGAAPEARAHTRTNLPNRSLPLFGRADDLAAIRALLAQQAVVTIVGAGGIGKTRVAQAVAIDLAHEESLELSGWRLVGGIGVPQRSRARAFDGRQVPRPAASRRPLRHGSAERARRRSASSSSSSTTVNTSPTRSPRSSTASPRTRPACAC